MKAINIKLATFTFAAMLLASCSDSTDNPSGGESAKSVVGKEVTSITDAQELAARVINFDSPVSNAKARTRAGGVESVGTVLSMEEEPKLTGNEITYTGGNLAANQSYVIKDGKDIEIGCAEGATLYITGNVTAKNCWNSGTTIIILKGGSLTWTAGSNTFYNANIVVKNYGTFASTSSSVDFGSLTDFYNYGALDMSGHSLSAQKNFYVGGDLTAKNIEIKQGANVTVKGALNIGDKTFQTTGYCNVYIGGNLVAGDFKTNKGNYINVIGDLSLPKKDIDIQGTVNFGGKLTTNQLSVIGDGNLYACSIECSNFLINSNESRAHINYLKTKKMYQCAGSIIYLVNNSMIDCDGTYENANNGNGSTILLDGGDGAKAIFKAKLVKFNGSNDFSLDKNNPDNSKFSTCYIFNAKGTGSKIYRNIQQLENNGTTLKTAEDLAKAQWGGQTEPWSDVETKATLTAAQCGYTIDIPEEKGKELKPVSDIIYEHNHAISATCVQPYNGKMYMSYHTRGWGHGACIEVFKTENDSTTMLQYLEDKKGSLDFNHLMIDTKPSTPQLYVVGSSFDSGAMIARIAINSNGLLNTNVQEIDENTTINPLTVVPLIKNVKKGSAEAKNDENCVVRDGNNLLVMSTRGYEVYSADSLKLIGSKAQPGKAKHIAMNGNNIATLYYESRPTDSLTTVKGRIEEFATGSDILTATPRKTIEVGDIAPNNGKNTIAIDGNYIYVCRSAKGLSCFDRTTGNEVWNWGAPLTANTNVPQGYANGVTYDSNYIYLACGGYGLVVLDKNNKTEEGKPVVVAKKRCSTLNSANYVTLDGGYIYVAYGQSRLQVFKLVDKKVNNGSTTYNKKK